MRIEKLDGTAEFIPDLDSMKLAIKEGYLGIAVGDARVIFGDDIKAALWAIDKAATELGLTQTDQLIRSAATMFAQRYLIPTEEPNGRVTTANLQDWVNDDIPPIPITITVESRGDNGQVFIDGLGLRLHLYNVAGSIAVDQGYEEGTPGDRLLEADVDGSIRRLAE